MKAIIRIDVPEYQIGQEVSCYFKDTMNVKGICEAERTGHWILTDDDFVCCSECEDSYYQRPIDASWYYCPHCGAKMEGETHDRH